MIQFTAYHLIKNSKLLLLKVKLTCLNEESEKANKPF